jgi:hypothetical protein
LPRISQLIGGFNPPEKYESQCSKPPTSQIGSSSQLLGKNNPNVPNHQAVYDNLFTLNDFIAISMGISGS